MKDVFTIVLSIRTDEYKKVKKKKKDFLLNVFEIKLHLIQINLSDTIFSQFLPKKPCNFIIVFNFYFSKIH